MWRIYYDNDRTYGSDNGSWADAPTEGVIAVVEKIGDKLTVHQGHDFYYLAEDGTIIQTNDWHILLRAIGFVKMTPIKFGRYTSNTNMARIMDRIRSEMR